MHRRKTMGDDSLGCSLLRRRQHRAGTLVAARKNAVACELALETRASSPILFSHEVTP